MCEGSLKVVYRSSYYNPNPDEVQGYCFGKTEFYYVLTMLFHVWLLKLLSGNKFGDAFNNIIFYAQHIISKDCQSFMEANFITIMYSGIGFIGFCKITAFQLCKLEKKLKKTKETGFKLILAELAVVHLIILIMRFIYPWAVNLFDGINEIFYYEAAHFVIAEGLIYIACTVFYLQDLLESMFSIASITDYDESVGWQNE